MYGTSLSGISEQQNIEEVTIDYSNFKAKNPTKVTQSLQKQNQNQMHKVLHANQIQKVPPQKLSGTMALAPHAGLSG